MEAIYCADVFEGLARIRDGQVRCCVTSPPYWGLRDYGVEGQLGLEKSPEEYVARLVEVFREVRRVLADDTIAADHHTAGLAFVAAMLWRQADRHEGVNMCPAADFAISGEHDMAGYLDAARKLDPWADNGIGPDNDIVGDFGIAMDDGRGVDFRHQMSLIMAVNCASATVAPSTSALPRNL